MIPPWGDSRDSVRTLVESYKFYTYICKKYKSKEACDFAEYLRRELEKMGFSP